MNLCAAETHGETTEFCLERFIKVSSGSTAPAKNWRLCLIQNANEAVWVFTYLNLDYSKHFWLKVNFDLEAKPAGSWVSAVLEWCSIHRRGREEYVLTVCACVYVCVPAYMCVCVCACMCIWTGGVTEKKKLIYHNMLWNLPGVSPLSKSSLMKNTAEPIRAYFQWGGPNCQPIKPVRYSGATGRIDERSKLQWRITISCLR